MTTRTKPPPAVTNYGAVFPGEATGSYQNDVFPTNNTADLDRPFDANQTYYLKSSSSDSNWKQRMRRFLVGSVPIAMAVVIMGFFTLYLLRDFTHLYPSRGGDEAIGKSTEITHHSYDDDDAVPAPYVHPTAPQVTPPVPSPTNTSGTGSAACSAHPKCAALQGDCCPTLDGLNLDCCN